MTARVLIVPYDVEWPRRFERERRALARVFTGSDAIIEHIGSTAVPGLIAKPVIDIMLGVSDLGEIERRIAALEEDGYEYVPVYEQQLPDRRYFRKPRIGVRSVHLHGVITGGDFWTRHLAFRDYLRTHPEAAAAYGQLKQDLATRLSKDEYTAAKSPFIERIVGSK